MLGVWSQKITELEFRLFRSPLPSFARWKNYLSLQKVFRRRQNYFLKEYISLHHNSTYSDILKDSFLKETLQELRILSTVILNCQVTKIVMNSGSQLSELQWVSQMSQVSRIVLCRNCERQIVFVKMYFFRVSPSLWSNVSKVISV